MDVANVPDALAERLGHEGTRGLIEWSSATHEEWKDDVLTTAVGRFEVRLTTEISALRVDMTRELSSLREEVGREISLLRRDMTRDLSDTRFEILKWSFLFWVGQLAAIAGLLAFTTRG
jgi:hypothetical protein